MQTIKLKSLLLEDDRDKVKARLIKGGFNPKDVEEMLDNHYDYVGRMYKSTPPHFQAQVISSLWAKD